MSASDQIEPLEDLLADIRGCRACSDSLPLGPRPVLQISPSARILITSQAPGTKVHESGIPFDDASGDRLRDVSYPLPDPGEARFFDVVKDRASFDALLQTNLSGTVAFKAAAAIVTPVAASLVSTLVPT